jgi:endonuclease/exonuclease/phosphatase family metal-dependent hydrolase
MKVLTYNIAGHKGKRQPGHLEAVAALILKTAPDVVGLQEVVHFNGKQLPEEILAEKTGMHACFLPAHRFKSRCLGNAVLCREPISLTVSHELPHAWPERRMLLEVESCVNGLPVTVFCTHLVHMAQMAARFRLAQATAVAKRMSTCWRPHLLMGDLNAGPNARELHPVRALGGADDHLDGLRSWPARRPLVLYDHIWPGPGWVVERMELLDLHVSDHRPLLAQLGWADAPRFHIMPDEQYRQAT